MKEVADRQDMVEGEGFFFPVVSKGGPELLSHLILFNLFCFPVGENIPI